MKKPKIKFNNRLLIYLGIILAITGLYFYTTRDLIFSIAILILSSLFFFLLFEKKYSTYLKREKKTKECIQFVNNFIITLSITNSVSSTYETLKESFNNDLKEIDQSISSLNVEDKIASLRDYFDLRIYDVFLKLLDQYLFNGGDILKISQLLMFDTRKLDSTLEDYKLKTRRKLVEFITMWGFTMLVLVIIQVSLSIFYDAILKMSFYPIAIFVFFVVFFAFAYVFTSQVYNLSFVSYSEVKINEKHKK